MNNVNSLNIYGEKFQDNIIYYLITKKDFLVSINKILKQDYFELNNHKYFISKLLDFYKVYGINPDKEQFLIEIKKDKLDNNKEKFIIDKLNNIFEIQENDIIKEEYIINEFINFCKFQYLKNSLIESAESIKEGNYIEVKNRLLNNIYNIELDNNIGHNYIKDKENRFLTNSRNIIPFPWEELNNLTGGGIGNGELILVCGAPKGGKSWFVSDIAAHASTLGKNVVFYTLELSEIKIGNRIDAYLTKTDLDKLIENKEKIINIIDKKINGNILIKQFIPKKTNFDDIRNHLDKIKRENNFVPDLVVIDYIDKLGNIKYNNRTEYENSEDLYTEARSLAMELNIPVLSPCQVNRSGAKDKVIEEDKLAGSYSKFMICDFAISIARVNNECKLRILGSRLGPDKITYNATFNPANGHIEFLDMDNGEESDEKNSFLGVPMSELKKIKDKFDL